MLAKRASNSLRIDTYRTASKQRILTTIRMNTYEKTGVWGVPLAEGLEFTTLQRLTLSPSNIYTQNRPAALHFRVKPRSDAVCRTPRAKDCLKLSPESIPSVLATPLSWS